MERIGKISAFVGGLGYLATSTFGTGAKRTMLERDNGCQICGSKKGISCHHIVSECIENGKKTFQAKREKYAGPLVSAYGVIVNRIPKEEQPGFRKEVRAQIGSAKNGVVICGPCHGKVHRTQLGNKRTSIKIRANQSHPERPRDLSISQVTGFMIREIINPALMKVGQPTIRVRKEE